MPLRYFADFRPNVKAHIVNDVLRNRNNDGQFLNRHNLIAPRKFGRLLQSGIAVNEVSHRQSRENRLIKCARRKRNRSKERKRCALLRNVFENFCGCLFGNCLGNIPAVNHAIVWHGKTLRVAKFLRSRRVKMRGFQVSRLGTAAHTPETLANHRIHIAVFHVCAGTNIRIR